MQLNARHNARGILVLATKAHLQVTRQKLSTHGPGLETFDENSTKSCGVVRQFHSIWPEVICQGECLHSQYSG